MAEVITSPTANILGDEAGYLLEHECATISKDLLHLPGPDFVDRIFLEYDRSPQVLRSLQTLFIDSEKEPFWPHQTRANHS